MASQAQRTADITSRRAALTLALCLPSDVLLYLLLPMESLPIVYFLIIMVV